MLDYPTQDQTNDLIARCHEASVRGGWWHDILTGEPLERNKGELLSLVHTEISEAYVATVLDRMDDKLPHRQGGEVELADTAIRLADYAGGHNYSVEVVAPGMGAIGNDRWAYLHLTVSEIVEAERKGQTFKAESCLSTAWASVFGVAAVHNFNVLAAIEEKMAYNATRADHKPENRAKPDGKQF